MTELSSASPIIPALEEAVLHGYAETVRAGVALRELGRRFGAAALGCAAIFSVSACEEGVSTDIGMVVSVSGQSIKAADCVDMNSASEVKDRGHDWRYHDNDDLKEAGLTKVRRTAASCTETLTVKQKADCEHPPTSLLKGLRLGDTLVLNKRTEYKKVDGLNRAYDVCTWKKD